MKLVFILPFVFAGAVASAQEEWSSLSGEEIKSALTDRTLIFELSKQKFFASGRTLFQSPNDSWGYWRVQGHQYCSQWPPVTDWDCYDVKRNGDQTSIQFVSGNDVTTGDYP